MAKSSGSSGIIFILMFLALAAGGYWFFFMRQPATEENSTLPSAPPAAPVVGTAPANSVRFPLPAAGSVPAGTTVRIDGSTSMVTINENLKRSFQQQFPGTTVTTRAGGTENGIENLLAGNVEIAAISRPLTAAETNQGLVAVPVATDQIAVVVGRENPFTGNLTGNQVKDIFQGKIDNWSIVGGPAEEIQVINRPTVSGTHQAFKELVLKGGNFGDTSNFTTLPRDETTGLLRALGSNGIGYATYAQVANQQTVRTVPINGVMPGTANYPFQRTLFYIYKQPASPAVKAFLGYTTSPQGQQAMLSAN